MPNLLLNSGKIAAVDFPGTDWLRERKVSQHLGMNFAKLPGRVALDQHRSGTTRDVVGCFADRQLVGYVQRSEHRLDIGFLPSRTRPGHPGLAKPQL